MGIMLEKMYDLFNWLYMSDAIPGLVWLIVGAVVTVLLVGLLVFCGGYEGGGRYLGFPIHLFLSLTFMLMMFYDAAKWGKFSNYCGFELAKKGVPFILSDIGTWGWGLKWYFFHFLFVIAAGLIFGLIAGVLPILPFLLTVPFTLVIFKVAVVVDGFFLGIIAYMFYEWFIWFGCLVGWLLVIILAVMWGEDPSEPAGTSIGATGSSGHADNFAFARMPEVIKDEHGNLYTRLSFDSNGAYVEYSGDHTVVRIYSEDVKAFSAKGDGHHFTW